MCPEQLRRNSQCKALSKVLVSGGEKLKVGANKISCGYNTVGVVGNNPRACRCGGDKSWRAPAGTKENDDLLVRLAEK